MNKLPPQQLSFDFDTATVASRPVLRPFAEDASVLTTHRSLAASPPSLVGDPKSIVSLCDFRGVKEQQKISSIYRSIISSISHIA